GDFGFGLEGRRETIASSNIGNHERSNVGFFSEYRSGLVGRFLFNVGLYANYNTDYDWQFYPGADLSFRINNQWKLSVSSGSAQRIPSFTDLYLDQRPGNLGNPALLSENSWQAEVGIRHDGSRWQLDAGYFLRRISDFIDWVRQSSEQPWQPMNFAGTQTHGAVF